MENDQSLNQNLQQDIHRVRQNIARSFLYQIHSSTLYNIIGSFNYLFILLSVLIINLIDKKGCSDSRLQEWSIHYACCQILPICQNIVMYVLRRQGFQELPKWAKIFIFVWQFLQVILIALGTFYYLDRSDFCKKRTPILSAFVLILLALGYIYVATPFLVSLFFLCFFSGSIFAEFMQNIGVEVPFEISLRAQFAIEKYKSVVTKIDETLTCCICIQECEAGQ